MGILWCPVLMMYIRCYARLVSVLDWMNEVGGGYSGCDLEGLARLGCVRSGWIEMKAKS